MDTEDSLTNDLVAAWDAAEGEVADEPVEEIQEEEVADDTEIQPEPAAAAAESGVPEPGSEEQSGSPSADDKGVPGNKQKGGDTDRAPVSWGAATREHWKALPPQVKAEIQKRERDFSVGIQQYAENSKRANMMDQALAPYQQYFAMDGGNPGQSVNRLLQTASMLQMGSAPQKAQIVAQLIAQFGVDINTLDHMLAGKGTPPEMKQQEEVQRAIQQAVAPYQQTLQQLEQQQRAHQHYVQQAASSSLDQFMADPKNEFYRDVQGDMADILDMSANRGMKMSLKDAYDRACKLNPEIERIIATRQGQRSLQAKRQKATSITGSPAGDGLAPADSMRSALEQAWDNVGRM
jgi:hypothetical protein